METALTTQRPNEIAPTQPATDINSLMAMALTSKDVTPEKLAQLFDLKVKVDARDAEISFNRDFALALDEMPRVKKNGKILLRKDGVDKGEIPYAKYEDLDAVIRPIESKFGFTRSFVTEAPPAGQQGIVMTLKLTHRAGYCQKSTRLMPPDPGPGRNGMQAIGSAGSYAKRYLTEDTWNIVKEGADNDGKTAEPITRDQADMINNLISEIGMDAKRKQKFLDLANAKAVGQIQRPQYDMCMVFLEQARRAAK